MTSPTQPAAIYTRTGCRRRQEAPHAPHPTAPRSCQGNRIWRREIPKSARFQAKATIEDGVHAGEPGGLKCVATKAFRRTQPRMDPTGGRDARYLDKPIHDPLSVTTLTPVAQRDHSKKLQPINPYRGRKCSRGQSGFHSRNPNLASTIAPPLDEAPNSNSPPSAFTRSRMPDSPIPALVSAPMPRPSS